MGVGSRILFCSSPDHQLPSKSCHLLSGHMLLSDFITGKQAPEKVTRVTNSGSNEGRIHSIQFLGSLIL